MTDNTPQTPSENEPTVLDLYKSVTKDWRSFFNFIQSLWDARRRAELDQALAMEVAQAQPEQTPEEPVHVDYFPWRSVLALFLALGAQALLEPPNRQVNISLALYILAAGICIWAVFKNEWRLPPLPVPKQLPDDLSTRIFPFLFSIVFALLAFWDFGGDKFRLDNVILWILSLVCFFWGLWLRFPKSPKTPDVETRNQKIIQWVVLIVVVGIVLFFRLYRTSSVPAEPFSDQAEKILDVYDISQGQYSIFFPRNTGREAIQMYWTLLVAKVFGTGLTFLSLKLGTALIGIFTLPFIYLLGKEFGGSRVGLFALFLFGIGYWPNVISRIGLRFPLYPAFVAPMLFFLIRGLRTRNRNDFLFSGLFLGLGLHGYSPYRIVPFLVIAAFVIYLLHFRSKENFRQATWWFVIVVVTSLFIFSPLLRYWLEHPEMFGYRAMTRLTSAESPLPGPVWQVFLSNLYKGLLTFNWDNGDIWVHSLPGRPALDVVTGALFAIGIVMLIVRYIRQHDWRDLLLLVSIPILIMPSVLSLAFPGENPSLNRTGGAAVAVFIVSALALDGFVSSLGGARGGKRVAVAYGLTGILFALSAFQNYDIVFNKFDANFKSGAWNTSEMGQLIIDFRNKYGETDSAWIVPYPYWVDTRLPGIYAGIPNRDFALWQKDLSESLKVSGPKMIIYNLADHDTENILKQFYPNGTFSHFTSKYQGKDFMVLTVEN
jgi:hypothetical protein